MRKFLFLVLALSTACTPEASEGPAPAEFCHEFALAGCTLNSVCGDEPPGYIEDCVAQIEGLLFCDTWDETYCAEGWNGWTPDAAAECLADLPEHSCSAEEDPASCDYALLCGGLE